MQKNTRFPETGIITLIEHERHYRRHLTRLLDISSTKGPFAPQQKSASGHETLAQKRQDYLRRNQNKRLSEIQKDNSKLLSRLIDINRGKEKKPSKSQPRIAIPLKENEYNMQHHENSPRAHSNHINRKKESQRIQSENSKMSDRLVLRESNFSKERMSQEYQQTREYIGRMRRVRVRSDKTLELGQGGVKFSKDLRIISHQPYLPALHSISTHAFRAPSTSRIQTENSAISCRATERVPQSAVSNKYRQKNLRTEESFHMDRRHSNSNSELQLLAYGAVTDRAYVKDDLFEEERQVKKSEKSVKSPVKYRPGDCIIQDAKAEERDFVKERSKSSQSIRTQDKSLIQEESQAKEESVQRSYYESKQMKEDYVIVKNFEDVKEEKDAAEPLSSDDYEEAFEAESVYASKRTYESIRTDKEKLAKGFSTRESNRNIEEYIEDYESLTESIKGDQ